MDAEKTARDLMRQMNTFTKLVKDCDKALGHTKASKTVTVAMPEMATKLANRAGDMKWESPQKWMVEVLAPYPDVQKLVEAQYQWQMTQHPDVVARRAGKCYFPPDYNVTPAPGVDSRDVKGYCTTHKCGIGSNHYRDTERSCGRNNCRHCRCKCDHTECKTTGYCLSWYW